MFERSFSIKVQKFKDPSNEEWEDVAFWQHPREWFQDDVVPVDMGYSIRDTNYR